MNRRNFNKKTLLVSTAFVVGISNVFSEILTNQNFNFMSKDHPNQILINDFFTAYAANDKVGIHKVLAEGIKWHIPGGHPLSGTKNGVAEVLGFFEKLHKGAFKAEPMIMGVNDNYVIDCHKNWSNVEGMDNLNAMSCLLWRIENGKIIEVHNFPENQKEVDLFFNKLYS